MDITSKSQQFLSWFTTTTGIKINDYVATGDNGIVFDTDLGKVIKFSGLKIGNINKVIGKDISGIVHIYDYGVVKVGYEFQDNEGEIYFNISQQIDQNLHLELSDNNYLSYIIMEKLNTDIGRYITISNTAYISMCDSELLEKYYFDYDLIEDIMEIIGTYNIEQFLMKYNTQRFIENNDMDVSIVMDYIQHLIDDNYENTHGLKIILQIKFIIDTVLAINNKFYDFHFGQLGVDKNGILKIFDIFTTKIDLAEVTNKIQDIKKAA